MSWLATVTSAVTGAAVGHHDHQRLGCGDHAAGGVDGQLLHDAGHRGRELGQPLALAGFAVVGVGVAGAWWWPGHCGR